MAALGDLPTEVIQRLRTLAASANEPFYTRDAYPLVEKVAMREGWGDPSMDIYEQYRDKR